MASYEQNLLEEVVEKLIEVDIDKWTQKHDEPYKFFLAVDNVVVGVRDNELLVRSDGKDTKDKRYSGHPVQKLYSSLESRRKEQIECLPLRKLSAALDNYK